MICLPKNESEFEEWSVCDTISLAITMKCFNNLLNSLILGGSGRSEELKWPLGVF